jgi:predicted nucleic acid-binding protein
LDRIFLDANVLYSAAYPESFGLARLWSQNDVELMSSPYAIEEARRNLAINRPEAPQRLTYLTEALSTGVDGN